MRKLIILFVLALCASGRAAPEAWAQSIAAFTRADAAQPPPHHAVVFVGSSSIVKWKTLAQDFPGITVINRGFGGSELADSVYYADRIVIPYEPRVVVLYAGDNDLNAGKTPASVASDFLRFCTKVQTALPAVRIVFIGIKPSLSRWKIHRAMEEANTLISAECAADPHRRYVDVWPAMLNAQGEPRPELYVADGLHMTPAGYAVWTPLVASALK